MSIQAVASNFWIACFKKILGNMPVVRGKRYVVQVNAKEQHDQL